MNTSIFKLVLKDGKTIFTGDLRAIAEKIYYMRLAKELEQIGAGEIYMPIGGGGEAILKIHYELEMIVKNARKSGITSCNIEVPL